MEIHKQGWLFVNLTLREIHNRYSGGLLGAGWLLLQPLLTLALFYFVFSTIFKVKIPEAGENGFLVFVALGLWPWMAFQESLMKGGAAIAGNASLVKKVAFPNQLLVYSAVCSSFFIHLIGMIFVMVALHFLVMPLHLELIPVLFVLMGILLIFTLAFSLLLSPLQVLFRDVDQFIAPLLTMVFYLTPILYPARMVPDWLQGLLWLNPMTYFVERSRQLLMFGQIDLGIIDLSMLGAGLLVFWGAHSFFKRLAGYFDDYL